ncbi:MAG: hypothetical protein IKE65_05930 [Clostridia bacterium]|nr:hypothetical protein [Clostridia bacterium]
MEEKKYSIDEILAETKHHSSARSESNISRQADLQAKKLLESIRSGEDNTDDSFEALMREITARTKARSDRLSAQELVQPEPAAAEAAEQPKQAPAAEAAPQPEPAMPDYTQPEPTPQAAKTASAHKEITIAPAPSDIPQRPVRKKSIEELVSELSAQPSNKIDSALQNKKEEKADHRERSLTRTGVIRKANALIDKAPVQEPASQPEAEYTAAGAAPGGPLHKQEKIVGDKEDIQTKAYNAYIRTKEKKKQDTGIIKTIDIKVVGKPASSPAQQEENGTTKVHSFSVIDEQTDTEKTFVANASKRVISNVYHTGNIEGQTRLEGFFDESEYEKISEDELEEQLELNRREKIESFELQKEFKDQNAQAAEAASGHSIDNTYAPEKETPIINDVIDYNSKNDQRAVYIELEQLLNRFKLRTILTFAAEIAVLIVGIFGAGILSDFGPGTANERIYIIINCALLFTMMVFNARAIFKGLKALFMLKPSGDSLMAFASLVTLAHCVLALTLGENGAGVSHIYVGAIGFIFLLNCFGKRSMTRRIFKNFRFLIKKGEKYSVACVTEPKEIKEFAKGADPEYADVRYNTKTEFATRFLANSYADDPSDTIAKITAYPAIGIALVIGVVTYFLSKDLMASISAATAAVLIGVPASSGMAFNKALENADAALLKERGTITGFVSVFDTAQTTAVVLESAQLFPANTCTLKGMKLFKKMQMDEAILYAASVLSETNHPLKAVFMESVSEVMDHMPKSYDTAYEAKLGLSTWIYDRKVLLGNPEMMSAHGIEIPPTAQPEEYTGANKRTMFLAIDGSVYAMFVVEYYSDPEIEYELQRLEASGVEILVKTEDSNVDADLICEVFDLESTSVKMMSMIAGNIYDEKTEKAVYNEAKIINRGDPVTFMRSVTACSILSGQFSLLKTLQYIAVILGVVIIGILSFMGSISAIGPVHIAVYGAFWMIVTNLIPRIYKAVPKR